MTKDLTFEGWRKAAAALVLPHTAWIAGAPVSTSATFPVFNPATEGQLAKVSACQEEEIDLAVVAARRSFAAGQWAFASPAERKRVLRRIAELIRRDAEQFALMDSLCVGKPIRDAYGSDVPGAASFIEWYAESVDKVYGEIAPSGPDSVVLLTREPIGVVGIIVPWNYPLEEAIVKLSPALAAGNSVVLKPSELSPFSALHLARIAEEAGLPAGVLNVVPGTGEVAGHALANHMDVDCLSFTGSTDVGKLLLIYSGQSNMKPVWLECGGKSPNIVFADCDDLELAAVEAVRGVFRNQGAVCSGTSRLLVEEPIFEKFIKLVVREAQTITPGNPLDPTTRMGAIVNEDQLQKIMSSIQQARVDGAKLLLGGVDMKVDGRGHYVAPTIFSEVRPDMAVARQEIFGPVLAAMSFANEAEAISIANDSEFGLVASVWTSNIDRAHRISRRLQVGTVTVNGVDAQSEAVPFGGYKRSGIGREHSLQALGQYSQVKATWFRLREH